MQDKYQPKVSIITVVYNNVSKIEETILSVVNQDYPNIEYIIIDGGSTDGTIDIINKYADSITCFVSEPDDGIYNAMNKGIDKASGEWINFMNSGDNFYDKITIQKIIELYDNQSSIIYGDSQRFFHHGVYIDRGKSSTLAYMPNCHQTFFVKTVLLKCNYFDTNYKICADAKFFYNAYNDGNKFQHIPIIVCNYDNMEGVSSKNITLQIREIAHIEKKQKTLKWKISFLLFLLKTQIKKIIPVRLLAKYRNSRKIYF